MKVSDLEKMARPAAANAAKLRSARRDLAMHAEALKHPAVAGAITPHAQIAALREPSVASSNEQEILRFQEESGAQIFALTCSAAQQRSLTQRVEAAPRKALVRRVMDGRNDAEIADRLPHRGGHAAAVHPTGDVCDAG